MNEEKSAQTVWEVQLKFKVDDLAILTSLITLARYLGAEVENITQKDKE